MWCSGIMNLMHHSQLNRKVWHWAAVLLRLRAVQILLSLLSIGLLTVVMLELQPLIHSPTAGLIYILVVLLSAMLFGSHASLPGALLSSLVFTYGFVPPYGSFGLTSIEGSVRLGVFLLVALLVSSLANRARRAALSAQQRAAELNALYQLSQALSVEVAVERILAIVTRKTAQILAVPDCQVILADQPQAPPTAAPDAYEEVILQVEQRYLGVLRVTRRAPHVPLSAAELERLETISAQVSLVLERVRLTELASQTRALAESDQLKSTLLSLVSHDLRTPLAVIKGLTTSLLDTSVTWSDAQRRDLLTTINDETDRLNRIVSDLLEMSRIEAGAISQNRSWHALDELIVAVATSLRTQYQASTLQLNLPDELPLVRISYAQIEQVLRNLIENAIAYAPAGSLIEVWASAALGHVRIEVRDRGSGVPEALRERIFEKFVRAAEPERHATGSGLGLAICKGLVNAHAGQIWVEQRQGGGAVFVVTLPVTPAPLPRLGVASALEAHDQ
jgi:two-component system, OmpR family, sensor histidine kinase KdpD